MVAKQQTMARSRVPVARVQLQAYTSKALAYQDEPVDDTVECPLCIETLDDTDRDFFPCPCGYQVCLFCYQRLQSEYNNTCPGCRQQYSDDLDAVRQHVKRKQQQRTETSSRLIGCHSHATGHGHHGHGAAHHATHHTVPHPGHAGHPGHGHAGQHGHSHNSHHVQHHASHAHSHAAAHRPAPAKAASAAILSKQRQGLHEASGNMQGRVCESASSGLPATANWVSSGAANSLADPSSDVVPPTTVDDSAWPSLGEAVASSTTQQQPQPQQKDHGMIRRRSSSSSLSSMQSQQTQQPAAVESSMKQDQVSSSCDSNIRTMANHDVEHQHQHTLTAEQQDQEQQSMLDRRTSSSFNSVEVTTVVAGARHSVCVPVSNHSEVSPFPEAATLLQMLQQAVNGSKLSSTEAAVQLVQCLRKLEADSKDKQQHAWLQQAIANGRNGTHSKSSAVNGAVRPPGMNGRPPAAPAAGSAAARAPPPGFGGPNKTGSGVYAPHLQQQDLAAARAAPYRPVTTGQQLQQVLQQSASDNYASQSSMHSVDSNSSLFSQSSLSQSAGLWTDNGLPGVDFGAGVGGLGAGIPAAVPARLQMLWAGASGSSSQSPAVGSGAASGYGASITPPPGFSNSLALCSGASRLATSTSRLLNGSYNPLSYADADATASSISHATTTPPPGFNFPSLASVAASKEQQSIYRPWP